MSLPFNSSSSMDSLLIKNNTDAANPAVSNLGNYNSTYGVSNYNPNSYQNALDL